MLQVFLESGPRAPRPVRWTFGSTLAHAALVGCAIALANPDRQAAIQRVSLEPVTYVAPRLARERTQIGAEPAGAATPTIPAIPFIRVPEIAPVAGPVTRPQPLASLAVGDLHPFGGPTGGSNTPVSGVYAAAAVDRAVVPRSDNAQPDYPSALRASGVEGEVYVRFVVDSAGRVEPPSIAIIRETHPLFGAAVHRWLHRTRYLPAEVAGRPVRQLVEQRVDFRLRP